MDAAIEELRCEEDEDDDDLVDAIEAARETELESSTPLFGTGPCPAARTAPWPFLVDAAERLPVARVAATSRAGSTAAGGDLLGARRGDLTVTFAAPKSPMSSAAAARWGAGGGRPRHPALASSRRRRVGSHLLDLRELRGAPPEAANARRAQRGNYVCHALLVRRLAGKAGAAIPPPRAAVRVGAAL